MPAGTEEQQRLDAVRVIAIDADHRSDERSRIAPPRDIDEQLAPLVTADLAETRVRVDERQPEPSRLVEQRPQLRAVAAAEIERLVPAAVVAPTTAAGARW